MTDASSYDLVVIGAGPAGEKAAAQAAFFRKRVLVIEGEPEPGGAAAHPGTLPSKTRRETALYLYGPSFIEMQKAIADFIATYPLCERCRVVQVA